MANKKITVLFVAIAYVLFANLQCNKNNTPPSQPDGLPLETEEGKNTFGCFWNDTLWLPKEDIISAVDCYYDSDSNRFNISIYNDNKKQAFSFSFLDLKIGDNYFDNSYPNKILLSTITNGFLFYKPCEPLGFYINIKKMVKPNRKTLPFMIGILSGTFNAKFYKIKQGGKDVDTTDSIVIEKAVFDLQVN